MIRVTNVSIAEPSQTTRIPSRSLESPITHIDTKTYMCDLSLEVDAMESLRTTIVLERELYREAKRLALEQDKTLREIIEQALRAYLRGDPQRRQKTSEGQFGIYAGKVRGSLRRENIYRDILK
jgi:hypothetical protein